MHRCAVQTDHAGPDSCLPNTALPAQAELASQGLLIELLIACALGELSHGAQELHGTAARVF